MNDNVYYAIVTLVAGNLCLMAFDTRAIRNERMNTDTHRQRANGIWSICRLLRGSYKRNECCQASMTSAVAGKRDVRGLA